MMLRGVGPVRVKLVGMRYTHIVDLDGTHERLTRHRELSPIEPPAPPAPPPRGSALDEEFLDFTGAARRQV
jgi:hypothetical protein